MRTDNEKKEDIEFLNAIKQNDFAKLGKESDYQKRVSLHIQKRQHKKNQSASFEDTIQLESDSSSVSSDNLDIDYNAPSTSTSSKTPLKQKSKRDKVSAEIPTNLMENPVVSQMGDRLNLSLSQRVGFTAALLTASNVSISDVTLSRSSTRRACKKVRIDTAQNIKKTFMESVDNTHFFNLHWDTKILNDSERLAVSISGKNIEDGKLLGIPVISDGKGITQASESMKLINEWNIANNIFSLVFDTTSSNSGWMNGACVNIENILGKKIFYFACRHHIFEIILHAICVDVLGPTVGPDNLIFKHFSKSWNSLDKSQYQTLKISNRKLKLRKNTIVTFLINILKHETYFPRDDYKELAELCLVIFGEKQTEEISWKKPGPVHHARWMAVAIYIFKMFAFGVQMKYDSSRMSDLQQLVQFISLYYVKPWFEAPLLVDAPINDLLLIKDLQLCPDVKIAEVALSKLKNHLWYLTEEVAPLALMSSKLSISDKIKISKKILKISTPVIEMGIPVMPEITSNKNITLNDFIGNKSLFLFSVTGCSTEFLKDLPSNWSNYSGYVQLCEIYKGKKCVNDLAERAIKLITDYVNTITCDEIDKQYLLQCVEHHRSMLPNFNKKELSKLE